VSAAVAGIVVAGLADGAATSGGLPKKAR
jgi:hypothetical protein